MNVNEYKQELSNLFGSVRRARGCFLYTAKEVRLTDLYQENGRAILGWGGNSFWTLFKNVLNRGYTGSFFTSADYRLQKAVNDFFFADYKTFVFFNKNQAELSCKALGVNPVFYKPWAKNIESGKDASDCKNASALIMEAPLPWSTGIYLLAVSQNFLSDKQPDLEFEGQVVLPPPLSVAVTRSLYNLQKELTLRQEKHWFIYDKVLTKYWTRKGPYLLPKVPREQYDSFVLHCLKLGIVINPDFDGVSIVPFGADSGVFDCLKKNPFDYGA